jgi:hypothetical protein
MKSTEEQQTELKDLTSQTQTVRVVLIDAPLHEVHRLLNDRTLTVASGDIGVDCARTAVSMLGLTPNIIGESPACSDIEALPVSIIDSSFTAYPDSPRGREIFTIGEHSTHPSLGGTLAIIMVEPVRQTSFGRQSSYEEDEDRPQPQLPSVRTNRATQPRRRTSHVWSEKWLT